MNMIVCAHAHLCHPALPCPFPLGSVRWKIYFLRFFRGFLASMSSSSVTMPFLCFLTFFFAATSPFRLLFRCFFGCVFSGDCSSSSSAVVASSLTSMLCKYAANCLNWSH